MSVSDEQRFMGMCECLRDLSGIPLSNQIVSKGLLCDKLSNLWAAFLMPSRAAVLGSDYSEFLDPSNVFGAAIYRTFVETQPEIDTGRPKKEHSLFDYVEEFLPTTQRVLGEYLCYDWETGDQIPARFYLEIIDRASDFFYSLNRYGDEFAKRFSEVGNLVGQICGHCYAVMSRDSAFLEAYYLAQIAKKCLTYDEDVVNQIWMGHNLHHDFKIENVPLLKLGEIFKTVQGRKLGLEERLLLTLRICAHRFHYSHQHKDVIERVKAHNKKSKEKISVKKVEKVIKKHCQEKKQPYIDNRYCWITGQTAEEIQKK